MDFAEIRRELETAERVPEAALREAVGHVDALAPLVLDLIGKLKEGVYLLPEQAQLLFYGAHVLAAARTAALWPAWCDVMRLPAAQIEDLFEDLTSTTIGAVALNLVGDDVAAILALLASRDTAGDVRMGLFPVLARLAWEGRIELAAVRAFLVRFAEEELAGPDDLAWNGWIDAVLLLGLTDLMPQLEVVMAKPASYTDREVDRLEALERLAAAAADFAAEGRFLEDHIAPFDDPVEPLGPLLAAQAWDDEQGDEPADDEPEDDPDPAADIALTGEEESWLRGFLDSPQVPATTQNLEMLDGFFTALVVGPDTVLPSEYMPYIWGGAAPAEGPAFDGEAQMRHVFDLLTRYWNMIARRISDGWGHEPYLFRVDDDDLGRDWAAGFLVGVGRRSAAWAPLVRHRKAGMLLASIMILYDDDPEHAAGPVTPEMRQKILDRLPDLVLDIASFWRGPDGRVRQEPRRVEKVGRNEPCPCGSGRKFKKCCGA